MSLTLTGDNASLFDPESEPVPGIAHGSIPGLLGVRLNDQMRAARASLDATGGGKDLSAPPTRTDAPADTPATGGNMPIPQGMAAIRAAALGDGAMAGARPPNLFGGGPVPALPPPIDVRPPPGANASPTPPPLPQAAAPAPPPGAMGAAAPAAAAPQQDNSIIPRDSLLGRLFGGLNNFRDQNRLTLLAMAGGLAGAPSLGTGLGRAFQAAVPAQQADIRQNQQNMTAQALMARGVPHDVAMAASTNPALLQQMLPQLFGAKQLQHVTIKDSLGNDIPMTFDPAKGKYYDVSGKEIGQGNAGAGGVPGLASEAANLPVSIDPKTGRDESFLAALSPVDRAAVTAILNGDVAASGRNMQKYLPYAARAEPGFSMQTYQQRSSGFKYWYGGGKGDETMKRLDQAVEHAGALQKNVDELGNWQIPAANAVGNAVGSALGKPAAGPLATNAHALADELAGIWKGGNLSDAEIKAWGEAFPVNGSIPQQKAAVGKLIELMEGGMTALEDQRKRDLGPAAAKMPDPVQQRTRDIIERLKGWAGGAAQPASAFKPPPNWQFSPSRQMYRDSAGKMYDANGNPVQ